MKCLKYIIKPVVPNRRALWIMLIFIALLFSYTLGFGQDSTKKRYTLLDIVPYEDGDVRYKGVVEVPGVTLAELHDRAKSWIAKTYRSAKDVIQVDNNNGDIIAKGYFYINFSRAIDPGQWNAYHTLILQFKDGRYRYELVVPSLTIGYAYSNTPYYYAYQLNMKNATKMLTALDKASRETLSSLNEYINKQSAEKNW